MSRNICQPLSRPDREPRQTQRELQQELGKLLITACPMGLNRGKSPARGDGSDQTDPQMSSPRLLAALVRQDRLVAAQVFSADARSRIGAIYLGKVKRIIKNLNACFVEIAHREQCFLRMGQEKIPPFLTNRVYDGRILEGDELLVQIQQEPIKSKQAAVTTRITLQGEYFVFAMGEARTGISKKLEEAQKDRLRQLLTRWQVTDSE